MIRLVLSIILLSSLTSASEYLTGSLTSYSGLIKIPNARTPKEGTVTFHYSRYDPYGRYVFTLSPYDWFEGALFYADTNSLGYADYERGPGGFQSHKDKGFSLKFRATKEGECRYLSLSVCRYMPDVSIGLVDFAGTGLFSSEYVVASKSFGRFDVTAGIGWGNLGSKNNLNGNPLTIFSERFNSRNDEYSDGLLGGVPGASAWFRGDSSYFAGVEYLVPRAKFFPVNSKFKLEYDSIDHAKVDFCRKCEGNRFKELESPISLGYEVLVNKNFNFGLYYENLTQLAFKWQVGFDFSKPKPPKYFYAKQQITKFDNDVYLAMLRDINSNGIFVQKADYDESRKTLYVRFSQGIYNDENDARSVIESYIRSAFPFVENVVTIPQFGPYILLAKERSLSNEYSPVFYDGYYIDEFMDDFNPRVRYPKVAWSFRPGFKSHIGSGYKFAFKELSINLAAALLINRNFEINSVYTYPLTNDYDNLKYDPVETGAEPVRIYVADYLREGTKGFDMFTFDYVKGFKGGHYLFSSTGHFEQMYSGSHLEYLYKPYDGIFGAGFEITYARQRDRQKSFTEFRDYETTMGFVNLYAQEPKTKLLFKLSAGRYLARDSGFTFEMSRSFRNGTRIGAFFSLTDMSNEDFGEGTFDKGIFFFFPVDFFTIGQPRYAAGTRGTVYRPITRDGGAKIGIARQLYYMVEQSSKFDH